MITNEIIPYKWGIASRVGDKIYINKLLAKENLDLYLILLDHELNHTDGLTWKDVKIDLTHEFLRGKKGEYYSFILRHPSTLTEFLPIWFYKGKIAINLMLLAFYTLLIAGGLVLWLIL